MLEKLRLVEERYLEMAERAGQPDFYADPKAASKLLREQKRLEPIVTAYRSYRKTEQEAQDLRGMLDALRLIRRGIPAGAALDMGITNKAFDSYEQSLIRDVIAARIPAKLDAAKLFG